MDSGASDHIFDNKSLSFNITSFRSLPTVTLVNDSHTMTTRVDQANPLPSMALNIDLVVPSCPFSLLSICRLAKALNFLISFFSFLYYIKRMIDKGCDSDGLYYLNSPSSIVCSVSVSLDLIHR